MKTTLVETKEFDYESVYTSIDPERTYTIKGQDLIRMMNEQRKEILDWLPISIYWKDQHSRVLGCNRYMANLFNYTKPEEVIGKNNYDLTPKSKADIVQKVDEQVMRTGKRTYFVEEIKVIYSNINREQTYFFWSVKEPIRDKKNKIIGLMGCSIDVTTDILSVEDAKTQIEQAYILCGTVVHDIKNQVMIGDLLTEKEMREIDLALENSEISNKFAIKLKENKNIFINSHLKISKIMDYSMQLFQKQLLTLKPEKLYLEKHQILSNIFEVIRNFSFQNKNQYFNNFVKNFEYLGDAVLIEKIITNLVNNALRQIEKKEKGQIFFNTQEDLHHHILTIKDTAGGVTQNLVDKIFDLYKTGQVQGTGFGLSSAKIYMEKMHGKIEVYLVDGDCIMFALFFPKII